MGSIGVTDAGRGGGAARTVTSALGDSGKRDARVSASSGSSVHRNAPDLCRLTQNGGPSACLLLLPLSPKQDRKHETSLLRRHTVDVLFFLL